MWVLYRKGSWSANCGERGKGLALQQEFQAEFRLISGELRWETLFGPGFLRESCYDDGGAQNEISFQAI
jgi:hypothetical protein